MASQKQLADNPPPRIQPLSYQTGYSCWVTSVTNGLVCLLGKGSNIPVLTQRVLHAILESDGVYDNSGWEHVLHAVAKNCGLDGRIIKCGAVEKELPGIDFTKSVAICDFPAEGHAILINGKHKGKGKHLDRYLGCDPDWGGLQCAKQKQQHGEYMVFPSGVPAHLVGRANVAIWWDRLVGKHGGLNYAMGGEKRRALAILTREKGWSRG